MSDEKKCPAYSNGTRCDICGAWCVDNCLRCGAPQCCPKCCHISRLQTELAQVKAERDQLAARVGELEAEVSGWQSRYGH